MGSLQKPSSHVNLPPSLQWMDVSMAELPERSRLRLLYNANDFDALGQGPVGLSNLVHLSKPFLLPPSPGWKQFGFTVLRDEGVTVPDLGSLMTIRWQFIIKWSQGRSAWDALLSSLDHISPQALSLPPTSLLPALFVVLMADRPDDTLTNAVVASWGPVLQEACQALDPLLQALYEYWVDGPSRSAARYRQFITYTPTDEASSWQFLDPLRSIVGSEIIEEIRGSEHLEASVIRQLCQASTRLWVGGILLPEQKLSSLLEISRLSALLPLAL